jgi:hypothetical protein
MRPTAGNRIRYFVPSRPPVNQPGRYGRMHTIAQINAPVFTLTFLFAAIFRHYKSPVNHSTGCIAKPGFAFNTLKINYLENG